MTSKEISREIMGGETQGCLVSQALCKDLRLCVSIRISQGGEKKIAEKFARIIT